MANNAERVDDLISRYDLSLNPNDAGAGPSRIFRPDSHRSAAGAGRPVPTADVRRIVGRHRHRPDLSSRLCPAQIDFNTDVTFHGMQPPTLDESQLAFDVLEAGLRAAGTYTRAAGQRTDPDQQRGRTATSGIISSTRAGRTTSTAR